MKIGRIYALVCPISNKIRYIGQTTNKLTNRLSGHKRRVRYNLQNGYKLSHVNSWINMLVSKNLDGSLKIELIEEFIFDDMTLGLDYIDEREIYWIKHYKNLGFDLTNISSGGKFGKIPNYKINRSPLSIETKTKISVANSGERNGMFGKRMKRTKEQKEKLSKVLCASIKLKESRNSKEFKDKISNIRSKALYVLDEKMNIVMEFKNTIDCAIHLGYTKNNIAKAVSNLRMIGKSKGEKYWVVQKERYEESIDIIKMSCCS